MTTRDAKDLPPYLQICWSPTIVQRPTDVVFLTHILLYLPTSVPSALVLFWRFTWSYRKEDRTNHQALPHAVFHWALHGWYCGSFTLMLHNHIHNNGVLAREYDLVRQILVVYPGVAHGTYMGLLPLRPREAPSCEAPSCGEQWPWVSLINHPIAARRHMLLSLLCWSMFYCVPGSSYRYPMPRQVQIQRPSRTLQSYVMPYADYTS